MNILVAYATAHGSTAEVAAFIGQELEKRDYSVVVANVTAVTSVNDYDAFVLGSPVHDGMWLTEMSQFLERFEDRLKAAPVAYFMTCIRVLEDDGYDHCLQEYVNHRVLNDLNITEITAFAGQLELDAVDWDERWALAARYDGNSPPGSYNRDFRDWDTIGDWARQVADSLLLPG